MLWKIGGAILVSFLAAIIVIIAGVLSDARTGTVMLRAVFVFAVSGFGLVFGMIFLERYGIPFYMSKHKEEEQSEWLRLYLLLKEMEKGQQEQNENGEAEEEPQNLLDVSVTDEAVEDMLADEGTEEEAPEEAASPEDAAMMAESNEAEGQEPDMAEVAEPLTEEEMASLHDNSAFDEDATTAQEEMPEKEAERPEVPSFSPLAADQMTRLTVPEEAGA